MAGRPPKPTAELKRAGTYTASRHGAREDETVATGKPRKPSWCKGKQANWLWKEITHSLADGVLTAADTPILSAACRWWELWRRFDERIGNGEDDEYRTTILAVTAWKQCDGCLTKLGMSPTERTRLHAIASEPKQNDKTRFFKVVG
jgi:P27 family predicted phage terminase small subunit